MGMLDDAKTWITILGPFAIPWLYSSFQKYRRSAALSKIAIKPVPQKISRVLNVLFAATALALFISCFTFSYENLITKTGSRIQTPQNVLWERVANIRPGRSLTPLDERLKDRLASAEGRCLFLMYGPDNTGNCPFCNSDEPSTFFYYASPSILLPHLLNMLVLGLSTSRIAAGKEGQRFQTLAMGIGCAFAVVEVLIWLNYDWKKNMTATTPAELFHFFGWIRLARNIGFAIIDSGLAYLLWATSTNRILAKPPTVGERLDNMVQHLEAETSKLSALNLMRSAVARDQQLQGTELEHWRKEDAELEEILANDIVKRAVQLARSRGQLAAEELNAQARRHANAILTAAGQQSSSP